MSLTEQTTRLDEMNQHIQSVDSFVDYLKQHNEIVDRLLQFSRSSMNSLEFQKLDNQRKQLWAKYETTRSS